MTASVDERLDNSSSGYSSREQHLVGATSVGVAEPNWVDVLISSDGHVIAKGAGSPEPSSALPTPGGKRADRGRRLVFAAMGGAVVAEAVGQVAERTLISESDRLQLQQRRKLGAFADDTVAGAYTRPLLSST